MLLSLPFGWMYLLPNSLIDFAKSILYSLGFTSNFYFWHSGQQYGAESSLLKPFLHTWSLSIEEQYYIIFPIILLIVFNYFRKYLLSILIIAFVLSLGIADWGSKHFPSFSFYVLPTRAWELLAGSMLAYFEITRGERSSYRILNLILPSIGFILIAYSLLFFNDEMYHPSLSTLTPIFGVCLIIWFTDKNEFITKILSSKLFVGIGLISYSLYLWHFPIFAFARINDYMHGSLIYQFYIATIILVTSILSYYFVEIPCRNNQNNFKKLSILFSFVIFVLLIFISLISFNKKIFPNIFHKNLSKEVQWNLLKDPITNKNCHSMIGCKFHTSYNKKVYILGDSHMGSLLYNLKDKILEKKYQFINFTGCLYLPEFDRINVKTKKPDNCYSSVDQVRELLLEEKNSIIILGGRLPLYLSNSFFNNKEGGIEGGKWNYKYVPRGKYKSIEKSYKNEILKLSENNHIILVYPIPEAGWHVPRKLYNSLPKKNNLIKTYFIPENYITTSYEVYLNRSKSSVELLDSINNEKIFRVYPNNLFCNTILKGRCVTHDDKNIFYSDYDHPSLKGAELINELILKEIEKIELKIKLSKN